MATSSQDRQNNDAWENLNKASEIFVRYITTKRDYQTVLKACNDEDVITYKQYKQYSKLPERYVMTLLLTVLWERVDVLRGFVEAVRTVSPKAAQQLEELWKKELEVSNIEDSYNSDDFESFTETCDHCKDALTSLPSTASPTPIMNDPGEQKGGDVDQGETSSSNAAEASWRQQAIQVLTPTQEQLRHQEHYINYLPQQNAALVKEKRAVDIEHSEKWRKADKKRIQLRNDFQEQESQLKKLQYRMQEDKEEKNAYLADIARLKGRVKDLEDATNLMLRMCGSACRFVQNVWTCRSLSN